MSDDLLRDLGTDSEELADLYAIKQFLSYSGIGPQTYFLERVEGAFVRPSYFVKIVSMDLEPYNAYMSTMVYQLMFQYFPEDYFEAIDIAGKLVALLGDKRGVIIPKYDFTQAPPEVFSVNGISANGDLVPSKMGIRVPPQTVHASPFQDTDDLWNVPVTFTARSPRVRPDYDGPVIETVTSTLNPFTDDIHTVTAEVTTSSEADTE